MKKTGLLLGAIALPVAAIGSVSAPSVAEAQAANPSWTGFYVGGSAGGAWGNSSQHDEGFTIISEVIPADGRYHIKGPVAGGGFGYNWQSGQWVTGFETDLSWADVKGHGVCAAGPEDCGTKVSALGTVRARLGWVLGGGAPAYSGMPTKAAPVVYSSGPLLYVTGGFAYGRVHAWDDFTPASGTKWLTGWTAGGGVEWKLAGNWTARLEYLYVDLHRKQIFEIVPGTPEFVNAKMNVVRLGLSYQFATGGAWGKAPITAKY
jgi:outer membrane immunogenic protein